MKILCGITEWHHIAEKWKKMFDADIWIMPEQKDINVNIAFEN